MTENSASLGVRPASRPAPKRIYKPRRGLSDISVLSKPRYGRSFCRDRAVSWRMSANRSGLWDTFFWMLDFRQVAGQRRAVRGKRWRCSRTGNSATSAIRCTSMASGVGEGGAPLVNSHARQKEADYIFTLPYNVPPSNNAQDNWQFCDACNSLYFGGYQGGRCPGPAERQPPPATTRGLQLRPSA